MLYNIQLGKCLFFFRVRGEKNSIFRFFFSSSHQQVTQDSPAETIEWKCLRNNTRISFLFINAIHKRWMGRCWWTLSVKLFSTTYIYAFLYILCIYSIVQLLWQYILMRCGIYVKIFIIFSIFWKMLFKTGLDCYIQHRSYGNQDIYCLVFTCYSRLDGSPHISNEFPRSKCR